MSTGARLRAEAATVVDAVRSDGRSLDRALREAEERVRPLDRSLLRMLCFGTLRHYWRLCAYLDRLLDKPLKRRDAPIEALLLVGLFQITESRVPDHAAVSATVEATKLLRRPKLSGLVNAVLRNFVRKDIVASDMPNLEAQFNHPQWLIDALKSDWPDDWQEILEANNARAPMWLRVNARFGSAADYLARYPITAQRLEGCDQALCLDEPVDVSELPGFSTGQVSVQDAAAQIAAPWLVEAGGHRVLDACAAPGGKTGHLLELLPDTANLTAIDADPSRLASVEENLTRLGLNATLLAGDASKSDWWDGLPYDLILLDAPCSATGVIRRHPDIKLLRRASDIAALSALQGRLLRELWDKLSPGGHLLYVTCSVLAAENDRIVRPFLEARQDALEIGMLHANNIRAVMRNKAPGIQVLPGTKGLDGFYFACLKKASGNS